MNNLINKVNVTETPTSININKVKIRAKMVIRQPRTILTTFLNYYLTVFLQKPPI